MEKTQKIVITDRQEEINVLISGGWKVIQIVPQVVSVSTNAQYNTERLKGGFCFLLEKN